MPRCMVGHGVYDVGLYRTQKRGRVCGDRSQWPVIKTPGTRIKWSTLREWLDAWRRINGRSASSKRHQQRAAHVAELASNMSVVNRETDVETLAAAKRLIERENLLPPRGTREGHPATEVLQRVGTVLGERRRAATERDANVDRNCWKAAA